MARFWSGTIDGIALLDLAGDVAGFNLEGAGAFERSTWTGTSRPGMLGNPHTQFEQISGGRVLVITFLHIPKTLLTSLKTALNALLPDGDPVTCSFTDGYQTITSTFVPNVPNWLERGLPDGDYINDCIIRLKEKIII